MGDGVASAAIFTGQTVNTDGFSPLLVGDGVASSTPSGAQGVAGLVSVPFSWGTVLHRSFTYTFTGDSTRFSPLLVGDGVASHRVVPRVPRD